MSFDAPRPHPPHRQTTRRRVLVALGVLGGAGAGALLARAPIWRDADPKRLAGEWREVARSGWTRPGGVRFNASGHMRIWGVVPPGWDYAPSLSGRWEVDGGHALAVSLIEARGGRFKGRIGWRLRGDRLTLSFPGSILNGAIAFFERA